MRILNFLTTLFMDKHTKKRYSDLAILLGVGIYADGKEKEIEKQYAEKIIKKEVDRKHQTYVKELVDNKLVEYNNKSWLLQKEQLDIVGTILNDDNWTWAEYLVSIIKADGIVTREEDQIIRSLSVLVEQRKMLLNKLKNRKNSLNNLK
jgi:uncharacterized tellurite resistance protein B-like protein